MPEHNRARAGELNGKREWLADVAEEDLALLARALRIAAYELPKRDEDRPAMIGLHDDVHTAWQATDA